MSSSTITLPITNDALRRLSAEAQEEGIPVEAHAVQLIRQGFRIHPGTVVATLLDDARGEAIGRQ
jgi:hypothetical protein